MRGPQAVGDAVRSYLGLCKLRVSLLASGSALAGAVLGSARWSGRLLIPWLGVLILAFGSSALNQAQEWRIDARMERTRHRPIPSGRVRPVNAFRFAGLLIALGLAVLAAGGLRAALLGFCAVAWYNGVYTNLKKVSAFAAVPGALTGAIPPAIGWAGVGASPADSRLLMVCLLLFAWQVPHFWLLLLDRGREYSDAGLPSLTDAFSGAQIRRIVSLWILGTAAGTLLVSSSRLVYAPGARYALFGASLWLSYQGLRFRVRPLATGPGLFRALNLFLALVLAVLCFSRLPVHQERSPALTWTSSAVHSTDNLPGR